MRWRSVQRGDYGSGDSWGLQPDLLYTRITSNSNNNVLNNLYTMTFRQCGGVVFDKEIMAGWTPEDCNLTVCTQSYLVILIIMYWTIRTLWPLGNVVVYCLTRRSWQGGPPRTPTWTQSAPGAKVEQFPPSPYRLLAIRIFPWCWRLKNMYKLLNLYNSSPYLVNILKEIDHLTFLNNFG